MSLQIDEDTHKPVIEDVFKKDDDSPGPVKQDEVPWAMMGMHGRANTQNTCLVDFRIMLAMLIRKFVSTFEEEGAGLTLNQMDIQINKSELNKKITFSVWSATLMNALSPKMKRTCDFEKFYSIVPNLMGTMFAMINTAPFNNYIRSSTEMEMALDTLTQQQKKRFKIV